MGNAIEGHRKMLTENCQDKENRITLNFFSGISVYFLLILLWINKGDLFFSRIFSVIKICKKGTPKGKHRYVNQSMSMWEPLRATA